MIKDFFSDKLGTTILWFLSSLAAVLLLIVNELPAQEIIYAVLVLIFLYLVYTVSAFLKWRQHYIHLKSLLDQKEPLTISQTQDSYSAFQNGKGLNRLWCALNRRILEENLARQNEASAKQRDMQEYYSMWVHQVKTPIAALRLLLDQDSDSEGIVSRSEKTAELFRIEQYVEMALQYARLDSEDTDFVFDHVALEPVVRSAVRKYARLFIGKKIAVQVSSSPATVLTDAKWIGFVMEQILSNAVKYTAKGSVTADIIESRESTSVVIQDTGIGIRAEDLPRICEKGFTGYNGHANEHSSGIGLYLCRRILDKLGHKLEIQSEEGRGTTVKIIFFTADSSNSSNLSKM